MASVVHTENKIIIPFGLGVWIISLILIIISYFSKLDFGVVGIIAWIIFLLGSIYFIVKILSELFS